MAWNEPGGNNNQQDPWSGGGRGGGGGGNNQGPPDLDELLRKLKNRLNGLLGQQQRPQRANGNDGGNGNGNGEKRRNTLVLPLIVIVVALVVWAGSGFYLVDQSQRGVVLRFGKYLNTVGPGLHWNPPLVDNVHRVNVTQVRSLSQTDSMLTKDENIVKVQLSSQYLVSDPRDYVLNVRSPEVSMQNAMDSALRHVIGSTEMNDILTSGRELVASQVTERLQSYLDSYHIGLQLQTVNVESTSPPDQVQDAFDDVIKAREERQRTINQAMAYENAVMPAAQGKAQRIKEEAQGYKESVVAQAQGDANRFTSLAREYEKAPEVTRERLYLETVSDVLSHTRKALVDPGSNNNVTVLPLGQLQSANSSGSSSSQSMNDQQVDQLSQRIAEQIATQSRQKSLREGR
ncbi:FtsH protease activity modulator HflK [Kushneria phosphatilytica]|uniref:Protein HflK n=1 Tax=Kushneria phosphatilytica TaxID=657387 RepID=A0A1S1NWD9_9GAMM|nr:FtsH protease activity modulator HflK [Kushneria phosphatilytica]OHV09962.1 HflK protein [Kushneria phosphatilytica]QEL11642.1 FtsH protease activity modulator HflK [Kushneria phosphatilytica]